MAKVDKATGRRFVELEFDLPGTPEQVWQALATGYGIACWFVPSEIEEREGGKVTFISGPAWSLRARLPCGTPRGASCTRSLAGTERLRQSPPSSLSKRAAAALATCGS